MENLLPQRLKELRELEKLSQAQLAQKLGYTQTAIAKWESGNRTPNVNDLIALAKLFQCSIDYLVGLED